MKKWLIVPGGVDLEFDSGKIVNLTNDECLELISLLFCYFADGACRDVIAKEVKEV